MSDLSQSLARRPIGAVVIGASAGGVEALGTILPAFAETTQAAVIVVIHLPRDRRSLLTEIFQPRCRLPVVEPWDKEPVRGGRIYFAPPDYHLLIDAGPHFALSVDAPVHYSRPSIDVLFESAADWWGGQLLGMLLTGGNQDGAEGLASIANAGGATVVQDPDSAMMSLMPQSALDRFTPDAVLSLDEIASLVEELWRESGA